MAAWCFVHVADMQPGSPRSYRYNPSWLENWREARAQILGLKPDLLLVGGDVTRDGSLHRFELEEMKADLDALPFPAHVIAGNMDTGNKHTAKDGRHRGPDQCTDLELNVTSTQLQQFASVFGPLWWSFDHKGVRFSGFTDVVVNSGLPEEREFWHWAAEQQRRPPALRHVWMLHYPLFLDRPDEPTWDIADPVNYNNWYFSVDEPGRSALLQLFRSTRAELVISSHVHLHRETMVGDARFVTSPATSFAQWVKRFPDGDSRLGFLRYDVGDTGIVGTFVCLRKTYTLEGYGMGGHPAPHVRDYSLAWDNSAGSPSRKE